ncbi:hypothetical protein MD484_g2299, partial [Candolleomyces efflorescens]
MPWLASASPTKFLNNPKSPNSQAQSPSTCAISEAISHEIQNVRSAFESRFNSRPKTPASPGMRSPYRQAAVHGQRTYYTPPKTADPRLCQFPPPRISRETREHLDKMYYSISERKVINLDDPSPPRKVITLDSPPPPRYDAKPPLPSREKHDQRTPKSSSQQSPWPNEKTPTSPYHPRQPPPRHPHTAHPLGAFPRLDPRDDRDRHRSPRQHRHHDGSNSGSLSATPEPQSEGKRGLFDFGKVKFNFGSPLSPKVDQNSSPSPRSAQPTHHHRSARDNRRQGYYEYQTPRTGEFDTKPRSLGEDAPKSAAILFNDDTYPQKTPLHDVDLKVPDDDSVKDVDADLEKGQVEKEAHKGFFGNWRARFQGWCTTRFMRPSSQRIPSVHADVEPQTLEEYEKSLQRDKVLSWLTVAGCWLMQFSTFGYIWSWNVFQDYYMNTFPQNHAVVKLAWIGSLQLFLCFGLSIVSGKLLDSDKFQIATLLGSLIFGMGVFALSFIDGSRFIEIFLVQGLFMGCGLGLVFLPSATICLIHFKERRAFVTGIVMSGSSFGAMIFPLMLDKLIDSKGFQGGVRGSSYMVIAFLVIANCLIAKPPKQWSPRFPPIDLLAYLKERHYALACGAIFLCFITMWFPQDYIEDFAVQHAVNPDVSFYSVAVIGIAGVLGRIVMGLAAERVGPWNLVVLMTGLSFLTTCLVLALKSVGAVVVVSFLYGFISNAWLSLLITALATLASRPGEIGHRVGTALSVASFGAFLSIPAHAGLVSTKWTFSKPVGLFAFMLIVATGILVYTRILISHKRRFQYI